MPSAAHSIPVSSRINWGDPLARGLVLCDTLQRKGYFRNMVFNQAVVSAGRTSANWVNTEIGQGVVWSGAGQAVRYRHHALMAKAAGTVELWLRPITTGGAVAVANKGTVNVDPMVFSTATNLAYRTSVPNTVTCATAFTSGRLYHLVARDDGTDLTIWLDGKLDGTGAGLGGGFSTTNDWFLGADGGDVIPWTSGVALFRVWNRALLEREIKRLSVDPWGLHRQPGARLGKAAAAGGGIIKTVNGLAIASVKTVNGLAIASVKTINGQATA